VVHQRSRNRISELLNDATLASKESSSRHATPRHFGIPSGWLIRSLGGRLVDLSPLAEPRASSHLIGVLEECWIIAEEMLSLSFPHSNQILDSGLCWSFRVKGSMCQGMVKRNRGQEVFLFHDRSQYEAAPYSDHHCGGVSKIS
jgi:hypothetical protein